MLCERLSYGAKLPTKKTDGPESKVGQRERKSRVENKIMMMMTRMQKQKERKGNKGEGARNSTTVYLPYTISG
jgi:hypothetical protein